MQSAIYPNPAFDSGIGPFAGRLERLESDDERRNDIAGLSGKNRDCHHFIHCLARKIDI